MRQGQSFLIIVLGLLVLWLAVSGRLESVWLALIGAATGAAPGAAGSPGSVGGGVGGGGETTGSGPILGVTLPDYIERLYPSRDRYVPVGDGDYRTISGGGWARYFQPVTP